MSSKILRSAPSNQSADAYLQGTFQKELPDHLYLTRTKVAWAVSTVQQLEAMPIKNQASPTFNFDKHDIYNPPNELKYEDLIKSEDRHELGRLSQGFSNVKGNNTLCFIPTSKVPCGKSNMCSNSVFY